LDRVTEGRKEVLGSRRQTPRALLHQKNARCWRQIGIRGGGGGGDNARLGPSYGTDRQNMWFLAEVVHSQ